MKGLKNLILSNKIVISFVMLFLLTTFIMWKVVNSKKFANYLSVRISKSLQEKINGNFHFEKVQLKLFPPGVALSNFKIESEYDFLKKFTVTELEVKFNILDLTSDKISISEVELSNVSLVTEPKYIESLMSKKSDSSNKSKINFDDFSKWLEDVIPFKIKKIMVNSFLISDNLSIVEFEKLNLEIKRSRISVDMNVKGMPIVKNKYILVNKLDDFSLNAAWDSSQIKIYNFRARNGKDEVTFKGSVKGDLSQVETIELDGKVIGTLDLSLIKKIPDVDNIVHEENGTLDFESILTGRVTEINSNGELKIKKFKSKICHFDEANFRFSKKNNELKIESGTIKEDNQLIKLNNSFVLYDLNKKYLLPDVINIHMENYFSNNFLYVLSPTLDLFKGYVTGNFSFLRTADGVGFRWRDDLIIKDFSIKSTRGNDIVQSKNVEVGNGVIDISLPDLNVKIKGQINSSPISGTISADLSDQGFNFNLNADKVNLDEFGKIVDLKFKGKGKADLNITVDKDKTDFNFDLNLKESEFIDFHLGEVKTKFKLQLEDSKITFNESQGKIGQTKYNLIGNIDFKDRVRLNLDINVADGQYEDIKDAIYPISKNLDFLPKNVDGAFNLKTKLYGMADKIVDLKSKVEVSGSNVVCYGEKFSMVTAYMSFIENEFRLDKIYLKKNNATITGDFSFNIESKYLDYNLKALNLNLADINFYDDLGLNLIGTINAESSGNGIMGSFSSKTTVNVANSFISGQKMKNSFFELMYDEGVYYANSKLFENIIEGKVVINTKQTALEDKKSSSAYMKLNVDNFPLMAGLISSHNTIDSFLNGKLQVVLNSKFNYNNLSSADMSLLLSNFSFERKNLKMKVNDDYNEILIDNGEIKKWNLLIEGVGGNISSIGEGKINEDIKIRSLINLDTNLLELIHPDILNSSGVIKNKFEYKFSKDKKNEFSLNSQITDFNFVFNGLPGIVEKTKFDVNYINGKFYIQNLQGIFAQGNITGDGVVTWTFPYPIFDLNFATIDSKINILKKTSLVASGKGKLVGDRFPYKVSGAFNISSGLVLDEPQEMGDSKKEDYTFNKFLPKKEFRNKIQLLTMDISAVTTGPIKAKNSLSEMSFTGTTKVIGDPRNLHIGGKIEIVPGSGRFIFKNNDFILSKGSVTFFENEENINPDLNFLGSSRINDYDVSIEIKGRTKNFEIDLKSKPNLPKDDILSLIAIGVTGDVSRNLNENDRQSMTNIGIGTLLFDKFKLNENLKSSLGLKVSVAPEFQEENVSLLKSKSASDLSLGSKYKSGTKVKIQKNINPKTDLSVSSTVTGSIGQKQEMNVNYNFNKNISAQGVYEINSNNDEGKISNGESAGMDLKFKWTFK